MLRILLSAIKNEEIETKEPLSDEATLQVIARQKKQLQDALMDFERGGRADLVEKTQKEIAILDQYLPAQMPDEELDAMVASVIQETGARTPADMGRVMGAVMKQVGGKADGTRVREKVAAALKP